ncbi:MAG: metallophosphoesterase family protein [Polyangiales bacterium]
MISSFVLIGDIHAQVDALEAVLAFAHARDVDAILSVGDLSDGDGDLDRTVALLIEHRVQCVRGNHDRWLRDDRLRNLPFAHRFAELTERTRAFIEALPATIVLETTFGRAVLCHAVGAEDLPVVKPDTDARDVLSMPAFRRVCDELDARMMLCGHTHVRMVRAIGPVTIINAGALLPIGDRGFVVVDCDARTVEAFAIDDDFRIASIDRSTFGGAGRDVWEIGF